MTYFIVKTKKTNITDKLGNLLNTIHHFKIF